MEIQLVIQMRNGTVRGIMKQEQKEHGRRVLHDSGERKGGDGTIR